MRIIEFSNIHRSYKEAVPVLQGVSFSIEQGEVVGLLGKNGAGKTTLMRIAMGMIHQQIGEVRLFGMDPWQHPLEIKSRLGYVSENQVLPENFVVDDVIRFHKSLFPNWDEQMEHSLCERFGFNRRAKIRKLSKGQARQVALMCAVSHRPELLLLDEPAGGLDPSARREFLETSIRLLSEAGTTILFSSHHMNDVERVAGRVVMIDEGRVLVDSDLDRLKEQFCLTVVPRTNDLSSERLKALNGCLRVRRRPGALHAVFQAEPDKARSILECELGITEAVSTKVSLEDLFVELVGGDS